MRRVTGICLIVLSFALSVGAASTKPNFSGTWVMDKSRSFSNPPGLDQTLVVAHNGDRVKVEAKLVTAQGERMINEEYTLDGKEAEFTPPPGPGGQSGKGKRKASWLPNDRGIVVIDETTTETPNGPVTTLITRKWTLSSDGSTLTVDYHIDGPRGGGESKRVFTKKG